MSEANAVGDIAMLVFFTAASVVKVLLHRARWKRSLRRALRGPSEVLPSTPLWVPREKASLQPFELMLTGGAFKTHFGPSPASKSAMESAISEAIRRYASKGISTKEAGEALIEGLVCRRYDGGPL